MKDIYGNLLDVGSSIIVTVSKGSIYLTTARILKTDETYGKILIGYLSTPKEKWIDPGKEPVMLYSAPPRELYEGVKLFKDNAGYKIEPGDCVAWNSGFNISLGKIESIESELWATLDNGTRVRNTQIIKI